MAVEAVVVRCVLAFFMLAEQLMPLTAAIFTIFRNAQSRD